MARIKLLEGWIDRQACNVEVYLCLKSAGPGRPAVLDLHVTGLDAFANPRQAGLVQIDEPEAQGGAAGVAPWEIRVPDGLARLLRSRVLVPCEPSSGPYEQATSAMARIQPEFLAPAVAAEIAERMHWPIAQLQMAECIARACAAGQWPAPVVNLGTFSVRLEFEGERLRLIRIGRDGAAGGDLKAAERVRYVRDCEAGRFSLSTPVEVFEGSVEPRRCVDILKEVGRSIGVQPYEDAPCFEDAPDEPRDRCAAMRG